MNKKLYGLLLKFGGIIILYFIVAQFVDELVILYVAVGLSLIVIVSRYFKKTDPMVELKRFSNVPNFLRKTERSFSKNETRKHVYLAYGKLYDGELEESRTLLKDIDIDSLQEDKETYQIYLQTLLRHEYLAQNVEEIEDIYKIVLNEEAMHPNTTKIAKMMILMIEEQYQDVIDVLFDIIPKEDRRHVLMELEIMLAEVYIKLGRKEDAKAVLEFVVSKKYRISYVEKAKSMLVNL